MQVPLDPKIKTLIDVPYTISYVIRKRQQLDSFAELPKEKRPPDKIIWEGTAEDLEDWFEKVFKYGEKSQFIELNLDDIEG